MEVAADEDPQDATMPPVVQGLVDHLLATGREWSGWEAVAELRGLTERYLRSSGISKEAFRRELLPPRVGRAIRRMSEPCGGGAYSGEGGSCGCGCCDQCCERAGRVGDMIAWFRAYRSEQGFRPRRKGGMKPARRRSKRRASSAGSEVGFRLCQYDFSGMYRFDRERSYGYGVVGCLQEALGCTVPWPMMEMVKMSRLNTALCFEHKPGVLNRYLVTSAGQHLPIWSLANGQTARTSRGDVEEADSAESERGSSADPKARASRSIREILGNLRLEEQPDRLVLTTDIYTPDDPDPKVFRAEIIPLGGERAQPAVVHITYSVPAMGVQTAEYFNRIAET